MGWPVDHICEKKHYKPSKQHHAFLNEVSQVKSVYLCIPTKHRILHQEYRDRKRRP